MSGLLDQFGSDDLVPIAQAALPAGGPIEGIPQAAGEQSAWGIFMIKLTRLDGEQFVLNADLIRYVERRPDTFITLSSGERIVVAESMDEVIDRAVRYQQQKHFYPVPANSPPAHFPDSSLSTPNSIH